MSIVQSGLEGLARAQAALEKTAGRVACAPLSEGGPSTDIVDISAETLALMAARHAFEANRKAIETGDQLSLSTLDVLG